MKTKSLTLISLFVAVMIVFGTLPTIQIPFIPVPFTFQMIGVMLVGSILGARKGFIAMLVFIILIAAGCPFLSGGRGGLAVLLGPTGGYVLSWPIAVFVIGLITDHIKVMKLVVIQYYFAILVGIFTIYFSGVLWLSIYNHLPLNSVIAGNSILFVLDLVKAALCATLASQLRSRLAVSGKLS
ncbi:hypothetical protein GMB86_03975 [Terrilactibacillus sp. BCM23-1]|uniref:Biotin transporter n=1 Tax=Terrilactibacillus tamarindi TaxID=2599694 RepID=A0A6N8CMC5_9BACI|nr:biotin transporter BioY [Terrilactibacillus tamarindi]MTT31172.1 hypothetical protein [Terrilactibacillus tamarindi]